MSYEKRPTTKGETKLDGDRVQVRTFNARMNNVTCVSASGNEF